MLYTLTPKQINRIITDLEYYREEKWQRELESILDRVAGARLEQRWNELMEQKADKELREG